MNIMSERFRVFVYFVDFLSLKSSEAPQLIIQLLVLLLVLLLLPPTLLL